MKINFTTQSTANISDDEVDRIVKIRLLNMIELNPYLPHDEWYAIEDGKIKYHLDWGSNRGVETDVLRTATPLDIAVFTILKKIK